MNPASARAGWSPTHVDCRAFPVAIAVLAFALSSCPARAQVGASVSVASEQRARGEATSAGRPVATFDLAYDHPSGVYFGGSATAVATERSGLRLLDTALYAGVAHRLASGPTIDVGVIDTRYSEYGGFGRAAGYSEVYVGLLGRRLSTRIHFSPGYYRKDISTLYAELDGVLDPSATWRVSGHIGGLAPLSSPYPRRISYDWRVGVERPIGRLDLRLALTGGGPAIRGYGPRVSRDAALIVSVGCAL